ncbi:MAG: GMC oxidoreductase [Candidatus Brocadiales bacterium]
MSNQGFDFDAIVIGSGFGGSVMTCRLAEKGYHVCLLERGKEYGFNEFPRRINEFKSCLWDPKDNLLGLYELLVHPESDIFTVSASGLGGGSLIYANVMLPMSAESFHNWPGGISRKEMDPYYIKVLGVLDANPYPFDDPYYEDTPKSRILKDAAGRIETDNEATKAPEGMFPPLAIWFKGNFPGEQTPNAHGRIQSRCNKCGECFLGCNIHSKSTMDLTYLARAQNKGLLGENGVPAEVRTHAQVVDIAPLDSEGYRVSYKDPRDGEAATSRELRAKKVIVSCGSVGTTGLLLKLKRDGSLPELSDALGEYWCGNGDLEATVFDSKEEVIPTKGPTITYAIKYNYKPYPDGFPHEVFISDAGMPSYLAWYMVGKIPSPGTVISSIKIAWKFITRVFRENPETNLGDEVVSMVDNDEYVRRMMIFLGMGRDRSDGKVEIRDNNDIIVKWRLNNSKLNLDRQKREMARLAEAMGGKLLLNPLTLMNKFIAVHPLGGCVMADDPKDGVVNTEGEAFNYPGLYVVDGSIIPTSVGPNPSLTIAAMAERIASKFTPSTGS